VLFEHSGKRLDIEIDCCCETCEKRGDACREKRTTRDNVKRALIAKGFKPDEPHHFSFIVKDVTLPRAERIGENIGKDQWEGFDH